jgi:hypothetical protein
VPMFSFGRVALVVSLLAGWTSACGKSTGAVDDPGGGRPGAGGRSGSGASGGAAGSSVGSGGAGGAVETGGSGGTSSQTGQTGGTGQAGLTGQTGGTSGTSGADPGIVAPTVDDFCEAWLDAYAGFVGHCGCDPSWVERYRESNQALCEAGGFLEELPAAVAAGDLTYDAEAAARLFARLRDASAPCVAEPFLSLQLDSEEVYSLGGVFLGTHELGEVCRHPVGFKGGISDCREGFCAWDGDEAGVCIEFVGPGEECDASGDENFDSVVPRLCHDVRKADVDGEYASAFDTIVCMPIAPDSTTKVCRLGLDEGDACTQDDQCTTGYCADVGLPDGGVCAPKLLDGEACADHSDCASGACLVAEPRVCGAPFEDGEECDYSDSACASGYCSSVALTPAVCRPAPSQAPGGPCASADDCISDGHGDSRDRVCVDGTCVTDFCAEYASYDE